MHATLVDGMPYLFGIAEDLYGHVASLKQNYKYHESVKEREDQNHEIALREVPVPQQNISSEQIESLQAKIQAQATLLEENHRTMVQKDETIAAGQQEIKKLKEQYKREIDEERKVKNKEISELTEHISELEQRLMIREKGDIHGRRQSILPSSQGAEGKISIKLKWKKGKKPPCKID